MGSRRRGRHRARLPSGRAARPRRRAADRPRWPRSAGCARARRSAWSGSYRAVDRAAPRVGLAAMGNQFVVELKNTPGSMAVLAETLAARGVDLRAIGGGGIGDSGHVIMTTADDDTTRRVLDEGGYRYVEGES